MFFGATAFAEAPFSAEGIINAAVEVTGVQATTTVASVTVQAEANVTLNTNLLTIVLGDEAITADANINLSTNLLTSAVGDVSNYLDVTINATTNLLQTAVDNVTIQAGGNIYIAAGAESELLSTVNNISVEIKFDQDVIGQQLYSTVATVTVDANTLINATGVSLNTTVTSVSVISGVDVNVSGNVLYALLGDEQVTASASVSLSTNLLQSSVDTLSIQIDQQVYLTGLTSLTTNVGSVGIGIGVELVGIPMTAAVGRVIIEAWAVVNTNVTNNWSVVDIAA